MKLLSFFKEANLVCSNCQTEIKEHEEFVVRLELPAKKSMQVGVFDKVLGKQAKEILCRRCDQKRNLNL